MHRMNDIAQIGKMIRTTRKTQKLTQDQLAATCGLGVRFIRELEQGKPTCQISKVLHVLNVLGLEFCIKGFDLSVGFDDGLGRG